MSTRHDIAIGLFFSQGMSAKKWQDLGFLSRELRLYRALHEKLGRIVFFTYGNDSVEKQVLAASSIEVIAKKKSAGNVLYSFLLPIFCAKEIRTLDILKTNQMEGAWTAIIAKIFFGKKVIVRCGYEWLRFAQMQGKSVLQRSIKWMIEWVCYHLADAIILTSQGDAVYVHTTFGIPHKKITIVPNYINTDVFCPQQVQKNRKKIVAVGRLTSQKNFEELLHAVDGLDVDLDIYGQGELLPQLQEIAQKISHARINFKGVVSNEMLPHILSEAQLFVQPSLYEGNPKTILEAMACGSCVIGADVVGIQEIIQHKKTGILCATDSASIREAIEKNINDVDTVARFGKAARAYIEHHFSLQYVVDSEVTLYNALMK